MDLTEAEDVKTRWPEHTESESEVAQSCPTLCDPMDCSPPGSSLHGILQAKVLEWVAFPSPGDLPDAGLESRSPAFQADALTSEPPGKPIWDLQIHSAKPILQTVSKVFDSNHSDQREMVPH